MVSRRNVSMDWHVFNYAFLIANKIMSLGKRGPRRNDKKTCMFEASTVNGINFLVLTRGHKEWRRASKKA